MEQEKYQYTTKTRSILADMHTPVGIYMRLRDVCPQSTLLECSDYHTNDNSRSFIGINPAGSIAITDGKAVLTMPDGSKACRDISDKYGVADTINSFLARIEVKGDGSEHCGLYGYTAFDAVRHTDNIEVLSESHNGRSIPDMLYIFYKDVIVFDHFNSIMTIITLGDDSDIDFILHRINKSCTTHYGFRATGEATSSLTDDEHKENIRRGIAHCMRGDVFQIVLSRRFTQRYEGDDFVLYRALRAVNPSPYLFYFDFGGFRIFGSSPETHCRIEDGKAYIDPIAGTVRRKADKQSDQDGANRLRNDPKENAEHVMLVDLARNDLSRNCHDVKVEFYKELQYYSHVIHLVSRVSGQLNHGADPMKAFIDTFPAGTLSGAPKVRAMQLISKYEPHSRGVYGGCIGHIGLHGNINQAITIRTFMAQGGELTFQAGGGIVADSNEEYTSCRK